jgi:hypothetical protein
MTRSPYLFGAFAAILATSPQTASAQLRTVVGVLECRAGPATTFVVATSQAAKDQAVAAVPSHPKVLCLTGAEVIDRTDISTSSRETPG